MVGSVFEEKGKMPNRSWGRILKPKFRKFAGRRKVLGRILPAGRMFFRDLPYLVRGVQREFPRRDSDQESGRGFEANQTFQDHQSDSKTDLRPGGIRDEQHHWL